MRSLRPGDVYTFVMNIRGMEYRDMMAYERHRLNGTPYYIEQAVMMVASMAVTYVNGRNGIVENDEDDPEAVMEGDVMAYLSEEDEGDWDYTNGPPQELIDRIMDRTSQGVNELYDLLSGDIIDVLEHDVHVRGRIMVEDAQFTGRRGLAIQVGIK